ncbi:MAG: hypothetical protein K9K81_11355 [Desulfobacteraceae bacterium]|nr:hypothetical protein [Desulfobacteraceae bacterium]
MKLQMTLTAAAILGLVVLIQHPAWCSESENKETGVAEQVQETMDKAEDAAEVAKQKVSGLIRDAEAFFARGELEDFKRVVEIYEQVLEEDPDNFEFNWKCARACRYYGDLAQKRQVDGWKDICAEYGKKGMKYAARARELQPDKPNGYYYYGLCVGTYSDGVGLITALKEGLKNKTQENLKKAYEIDKDFENGGPIVALGRFWQVVPWPYNDKDRALELYREFQKTEYFKTAHGVAAHVYMAEILMDKWGSEPKQEARELLEEAISLTDNPYWEKKARQMLNEL